MRLKLLRRFRQGTGCVPKKFVVFKAALVTGKVVCLKLLGCFRLGRFRHGTGCVPNKLVVFKDALGTGKVVSSFFSLGTGKVCAREACMW